METSNENSDNVVSLFPGCEELPKEIGDIRMDERTLIEWAIKDLGINLTGDEIEIALNDPELAEAIDEAILSVKRKITELGLVLIVEGIGGEPQTDEGESKPDNLLKMDPTKRRNTSPVTSDLESGELVRFVSQTEQNLIAAKQKVRATKKARKAERAKNAWMDAYLLMTGQKVAYFRKKRVQEDVPQQA